MTGRRKLNRFRVTIPEQAIIDRYMLSYLSRNLYYRPETERPISSSGIFGNEQPLILDLGCGRGEFIIAQAQRFPAINFVGIDSHRKSLYDAVNKLSQQALKNLKFIHADLRWVLGIVPDGSVEEAFLLFPAPLMKKRYIKKDVLTASFIRHIHRILKDGGRFHFVTDIAAYFEVKLALINDLDLLSPASVVSSFEGGITRYQKLWEDYEEPSLRIEYVKAVPK